MKSRIFLTEKSLGTRRFAPTLRETIKRMQKKDWRLSTQSFGCCCYCCCCCRCCCLFCFVYFWVFQQFSGRSFSSKSECCLDAAYTWATTFRKQTKINGPARFCQVFIDRNMSRVTRRKKRNILKLIAIGSSDSSLPTTRIL